MAEAELNDRLTSDWYDVAKMGMGRTMDEIRRMFDGWIIEDAGDTIILQHKSLLVTFQEEGGRAILSDKFERYDPKTSRFIGRFSISCKGCYGNRLFATDVLYN